MSLTQRVEDCLTLYGKARWIDLACALHALEGERRVQLQRCLQTLTHFGWVLRRRHHGLTYYRLER